MKNTLMKKFLVMLPLAFLLPGTAQAAGDATLIGAFKDWKAYSFADNGKKVCFMSAKPTEQKGKFKKRGDVLLFVTHWPAQNNRNVVSVSAGYPYKTNSEATILVGGNTFKLRTEGEMAWTQDQAADDAIAAAIRKGSTLEVKGTSQRGTDTTDVYSLKGSSAALDAITKECGL